MQLFELVSPRLFRPLAGPNRAFYAELLLLLWEECRHTADYSISRAEAVSRAEDYLRRWQSRWHWMPMTRAMNRTAHRDPHTLALGFCSACAAPAGWKSSPAAMRKSLPLPLCPRWLLCWRRWRRS